MEERMTRTRRAWGAALAASALVVLAACGSDSEGGGGGDGSASASGEVEVFTWWAEGSEKDGLDALVSVFNEQSPDVKFVNGAVAGGAGSDAKAVLASRLQTNDPPGTFQAHAGAELTTSTTGRSKTCPRCTSRTAGTTSSRPRSWTG
jgi:glucose/mannose transport system substrate-binding protein